MAQRRVNLDDDPFADGDGGEDDIIARMLRDDEAQRQAHQKARVSFAAKLIKGGADADDDDEGRLQPEEEDDDDVAPGQLIPLSKHSGKKKAPPAASSSLVRSQAKKGVKRAPPLPRPIAHSTTKEQSAVTSNNSNKSRKTEESIPAETPTPTSAPILNPAVAVSAKPKKRKASVPVKQQQQEEEKEEQPRHNTQEEKKHKEEVQEPALFSLPVMAPLVALPVVVAAAATGQPARDEKPLTQADRMDARLKKVTAFPSDEDVEKCGDWVMLALFAFKLTGAYFNCPPDRVSNYAAYSSEASYLFFRHLYARTQVAAAWIHLCEQSGNADMATIARMMPHCKLYIEAKSKVMAQDAVCVWSGETTNLHPVALVPIDEMCTWSLGSFIKEPGLQPIQFHIAAAFKDALKCVHTLLFALDYIPFQLDAGKKKTELILKGDWCPEMERELEEKVLRSKTGPLYGIRKSVGDMIKANMNAFRTIVGPEISAQFLVPFRGYDGCSIKEAEEKKLAKAMAETAGV